MPTEEKFGTFIKEKRIACGITLRGLASEIGIAPAYMSDIEKGHRYPPDKDKLYAIATTLHLSEDDRDKMFDLAANAKENTGFSGSPGVHHGQRTGPCCTQNGTRYKRRR